MGKGAQTRESILRQAADLSSTLGLEGLSIGVLAKEAGLSKSGLYAHFRSKEQLQRAVLDATAERFIDVVISPALKQPRGRPRLQALFDRWLHWEESVFSGGCVFMAASVEFDDRPGAVRDSLRGHLRDLLGAVERAASIAVSEGHLAAELDTAQFAFDFWSLLLGYQSYSRLLDDADARARAESAFANLLRRNG
jgi:AcrR family transcriptional regulator